MNPNWNDLIEIQPAKGAHLRTICNFIQELNVSRQEYQGNGLIEYPNISKNNWRSRLSNNNYVHIIKLFRRTCGISVAYPVEKLNSHFFDTDQIVSELRTKNENFIYWDLLALKKKYQGAGIAKAYSKKLMSLIRGDFDSCYGAVCHYPHKNQKQIGILNSLGFELDDELKVYDGLLFGLYKLDFSD